MNFVRKILGPLDLIGGEFGFQVNSNPRQVTCISCLASFLIYLISAIVFVKLFFDYFTTTDPSITQTFTQSIDYPLIDLYAN